MPDSTRNPYNVPHTTIFTIDTGLSADAARQRLTSWIRGSKGKVIVNELVEVKAVFGSALAMRTLGVGSAFARRKLPYGLDGRFEEREHGGSRMTIALSSDEGPYLFGRFPAVDLAFADKFEQVQSELNVVLTASTPPDGMTSDAQRCSD